LKASPSVLAINSSFIECGLKPGFEFEFDKSYLC
jgi:hypothetical protein